MKDNPNRYADGTFTTPTLLFTQLYTIYVLFRGHVLSCVFWAKARRTKGNLRTTIPLTQTTRTKPQPDQRNDRLRDIGETGVSTIRIVYYEAPCYNVFIYHFQNDLELALNSITVYYKVLRIINRLVSNWSSFVADWCCVHRLSHPPFLHQHKSDVSFICVRLSGVTFKTTGCADATSLTQTSRNSCVTFLALSLSGGSIQGGGR